MIRISQVRVIDEEGNQLGVMPTPRALQLAQERGFDLVEVLPQHDPSQITALLAANIVYEFISLIALRKKLASEE